MPTTRGMVRSSFPIVRIESGVVPAHPISGLPEIGTLSAHVGYSRHAMGTHNHRRAKVMVAVDRVTRITYWRRIRPTCAWNIVARQLAAPSHCVSNAVPRRCRGEGDLIYPCKNRETGNRHAPAISA